MKKKILTICLTLLLSIPLICKHISVKASENAWTSTGIKAIDCNNKTIEDVVSDGCLISIVDFLDTIQNYIYFINLHEQKNYEVINKDIVDVINFINCLNEFKGKYSYFEDSSNYGSYFIYFHSKSKLNNWLVNNRYIDPLQTFEDPIYGFTGPEQNKIERNPYICLDALLKSDLNYQIIDPRTLPKEFYKENEKTIGNKWYTIYNSYDFSIINGIWNYQIPAITTEGGETSKIEIPDSVGNFKKVSGNTYQYTYTELKWNNEFGYYSHNQAEVKTITLQENEMPSIAFDSNGYLKDDYYSVNNNTWYKAYVKDVTKEVGFKWTYKKCLSDYFYGEDRFPYVYFEIYFNFDLPVDCLLKLDYKLPIYFNRWYAKNKYIGTFNCSLSIDDKVLISPEIKPSIVFTSIFNTFDNTVYKNPIVSSILVPCIQNEGYELLGSNGESQFFEFKTIFVDNDYWLYDANTSNPFNRKNIRTWGNNLDNGPTLFNKFYYPSNLNGELVASAIYSYKGVLYSFENIEGVLVPPTGHPDEDDIFSKILKWLKELFSKLINWFNNSTFGKILKWILIVIFLLLTIYIIYKIVYAIKMSKFLKNKKSTR